MSNTDKNYFIGETEFQVTDDALIRYDPSPEYGNSVMEWDIVISKDAFIECYNKWIKEDQK